MISRRLLALLFAGGVLFLPGCARPPQMTRQAPLPEGELPLITVIPGGSEKHWDEARRGAEAAGKKMGARIEWKVPDGVDPTAMQGALIETAAKKSQGIVVAPLDSTRLMRHVAGATKAGARVVVFNSDVFTIQNKLCYVSNDDYQTGVLAARQIREEARNRSEAFGLIPVSRQPEIMERAAGFETTLKKELPKIVIRWGTLNYSPNAAVFASDESIARDIVPDPSDLLEPNDKTKIVAFGAGVRLRDALQRGAFVALIAPDYYQMAYQSVKAILDHRAFKDVPREIKVAPRIIKSTTRTQRHKEN